MIIIIIMIMIMIRILMYKIDLRCKWFEVQMAWSQNGAGLSGFGNQRNGIESP